MEQLMRQKWSIFGGGAHPARSSKTLVMIIECCCPKSPIRQLSPENTNLLAK